MPSPFYRDAQSMEKSVFYRFVSLVSVYRQKMIYGRIYGLFLTRFGYSPLTPLNFRDSRYFARRVNFFSATIPRSSLLPKSQDFRKSKTLEKVQGSKTSTPPYVRQICVCSLLCHNVAARRLIKLPKCSAINHNE